MANLTLKAARDIVRGLGNGFRLAYNPDTEEYRLTPKIGGSEANAYYTQDLDDAVSTARNWR